MTIKIDSDRAVINDEDDQYDFVSIAKRLAPSILEAVIGEGLVIGLEGQWGSGKTSLLNYLQRELVKGEVDNIHTISVTPWLNGDAASLVESVLNPMTKILTEVEKARISDEKNNLEEAKDKIIEVGNLLNEYTQKTARNLVPFAKLIEAVVPGAGVATKILESGANTLDTLKKDKTPIELKKQISEKIKELNMGFVIILDDLDRLEPAQAVEVVRLVRSVADFPNVVYLMCYDRDILAQALKTGLKVKDGDLYLQKIVQLTFAIPLPEPFDLRTQFRKGAEEIYEKVTGTKPKGELLVDLKSAVDRQGVGLTTPREVKLALNGIRFVYPSIVGDVYFPDFCRLHLIKTTNFQLYKWLEEYLAVRSILITGDGSLNIGSQKKMGKRLKKLLPSDDIGDSQSIWNLGRFIPGLERNKEADKCVFSQINEKQASDYMVQKRLGSPLHYRFYFALTGPKTVMPDAEFNEILRLAHDDVPQLKTNLLEKAQSFRGSGKTWLEHVLDRLDNNCISQLDVKTCSGLIFSISDIMDKVLENDEPRAFDFGVGNLAIEVVKTLFSQLKELDNLALEEVSTTIAKEGEAINWLVGYFFWRQMDNHGMTTENEISVSQRFFTEEQLENLLDILNKRLALPKVQNTFPTLPKLSILLYAWCEISGEEVVKAWLLDYCKTNEGFLTILNHLRHWMMSDKVYYPLSKKSINHFFDFDNTLARLDSLVGGEFDDKVKELKAAIDLARN